MTLRVLHFIGDLGGGDSAWLLDVMERLKTEPIQMDFLVARQQNHAHDHRIRELGGRIIRAKHPPGLEGICLNLRQVIRRYGPYDIFHSHANYSGGYTIWRAARLGVPVRIAHSHLDTRSVTAHYGLLRKLYQRLSEFWIEQCASAGIAASRMAADALFGEQWEKDARWQVLFYGIDVESFRAPVDSQTIRASLGIPPDAFVLGHVGRFHEQKNHRFLLDIAHEAIKSRPNIRLLLVGEGPLRGQIEERVRQLGLDDLVIFAGYRRNIPELMKGAMDRFVFPSIYEGLGIVLLEAQAANLPCICSDTIPNEVTIVPGLVTRISLNTNATEWARVCVESTSREANSLQLIENSHFNIDSSAQKLIALYRQMVQ